MGKTEDAFGKKRDHNQYGEVEKSRKDKKIDRDREEGPNQAKKKPPKK